MGKIYTALGLMSGTSMDGVDASIISSIDGIQYDQKFNQYYEYDKELYKNLSNIRDKIFTSISYSCNWVLNVPNPVVIISIRITLQFQNKYVTNL